MRSSKLLIGATLVLTVAALLLWKSVRENNNVNPQRIHDPFKGTSHEPVSAGSTPNKFAIPVKSVQVPTATPAPATTVSRHTLAKIDEPAESTQVPPQLPLAQGTSAKVRSSEAVATENMYIAHASLRTRQESNPDSPENIAILNTMIRKGLSHASNANSSN